MSIWVLNERSYWVFSLCGEPEIFTLRRCLGWMRDLPVFEKLKEGRVGGGEERTARWVHPQGFLQTVKRNRGPGNLFHALCSPGSWDPT